MLVKLSSDKSKGFKMVDIKLAAKVLRKGKTNPAQDWVLDQPGYSFNGTEIIKVEKKPKE